LVETESTTRLAPAPAYLLETMAEREWLFTEDMKRLDPTHSHRAR